jgi:hypothetical protein
MRCFVFGCLNPAIYLVTSEAWAKDYQMCQDDYNDYEKATRITGYNECHQQFLRTLFPYTVPFDSTKPLCFLEEA